MDLSTLFKSHLKKSSNHFGANMNVEAVRHRVEDHRRQTRTNLMVERRQIPQVMSPITPAPSARRQQKKEEEQLKPSKRLEMLAKWKIEKQQRKMLEKQKSKPIFKVYHVDNKIGLQNLETVNKEIKGKPIKSKSKFAPDDHKFKAPININPVNIVQNKTIQIPPSINKMVTRSQKVKKSDLQKLEEQPKRARNNAKSQNEEKKQTLPNKTGRKMRHLENEASSSKSNDLDLKTPNKKLKNPTTRKNENTTITESLKKNEKSNKKTKTRIIQKNANTKEFSETNENKSKTPSVKKNENSMIDKLNSAEDDSVAESVKEISPRKSNSKIELHDHANDKRLRTSTPLRSSSRRAVKTPVSKKRKPAKNEQSEFSSSSSTSLPTEAGIPDKLTEPINKSLNKSESSSNSQASGSFKSISTDYPQETIQDDSLSSQPKTPNNKMSLSNSSTFVAYVSPFVTASRGKDNARKEYHSRKSKGGYTPELPNSSPTMGALYFRKLLNEEVERITKMCDEWSHYKEQDLPEEVSALIDVAIGQSNLLMTKKFRQFSNLLDVCNNNSDDLQKVTCEDLHGYWDTMYIQIDNIDKRFDNLNQMKQNNWIEVLPIVNKQKRQAGKKVKKNKAVKATSRIRDAIKQAKLKNQQNQCEEMWTNNIVEEVKTPNLRNSILNNVQSNEKRRNSSPGLIMMKVSMLSKDVATPGKSILKPTNSCKSSKKKAVLFKDDCNNSSNDEENNLNVSNKSSTKDKDAPPKRRSSRIRLSRSKLF